MKPRRESNNLLMALEAAVSECRRLQERVDELEGVLQTEKEVEYENASYKPSRGRRNRKPKFRREEPTPQQVLLEPVNRRGVNDIYKEQKAKYESRVERQLAEQAQYEAELQASVRNDKPVDVRISEAKQKLLIETGKNIMKTNGK